MNFFDPISAWPQPGHKSALLGPSRREVKHIDQGVGLTVASELAAHSSPTTTKRYDRRGERSRHAAAQTIVVPYVWRGRASSRPQNTRIRSSSIAVGVRTCEPAPTVLRDPGGGSPQVDLEATPSSSARAHARPRPHLPRTSPQRRTRRSRRWPSSRASRSPVSAKRVRRP